DVETGGAPPWQYPNDGMPARAAASAAPTGSSRRPRSAPAATAAAPSSRTASAPTAATTPAKRSYRRAVSKRAGPDSMASIPRIGIDAMGGDFGPSEVAEGTVLALREMPGRFEVTLVGNEGEIRPALKRLHADGLKVDVVHAPERIEMSEKAALAVRKKSQSSLVVLTQLHKQGKLDAIFSAGNTGAVVATALLGLGRLEPVSRPALAAFVPNAGGGTVVLDVGANAECKASYLVQFAHMGAVYARYLLGRENPRVGLLSIGEEDTKGNNLVLEALPLLR